MNGIDYYFFNYYLVSRTEIFIFESHERVKTGFHSTSMRFETREELIKVEISQFNLLFVKRAILRIGFQSLLGNVSHSQPPVTKRNVARIHKIVNASCVDDVLVACSRASNLESDEIELRGFQQQRTSMGTQIGVEGEG